MVVTGQVYNLGEWPATVVFVVFKAWWFNKRWHLISIDVHDADWNHFAEWPLWALTEKQEKRMEDCLRQLVTRPHP